MVILIDNYDSFSYNLYQLIGTITPNIYVIRNDEFTTEEIEKFKPSHIVISPGPGKPSDAGVCEDVVRYFKGKVPILGVCLGHQAICETFGARISYAKQLMHGKKSVIELDTGSKLFKGLKDNTEVARYHSLAVVKETMPEELMVTAVADDGEVMAVQHTGYSIYGVQFHPESVMTPDGTTMIKNFLEINGGAL